MTDSSSGGRCGMRGIPSNSGNHSNPGQVTMDTAAVTKQLLAGMDTDTSLVKPDMNRAKADRAGRTHAAMKALDSCVAGQVLPQTDGRTAEEKAATQIQAQFRGYCGRKLYVDKLYQRFQEDEEMRLEKTRKQMEEGQLLVENHRLEVQLDDNTTTRRNKSRQYITNVITIQRAWRSYKARGRQQSSEHYNNNNSMSPQPSETELSDTESVNGQQAMSVSTPGDSSSDRNLQPEDEIQSDLDSAISPDVETKNDTKDGASDYSEMARPLRQHLANVDVAPKVQVASSAYGMFQSQPTIIREPEETDEEYNKRVRKINFLSLAQEFAALKKVDSTAQPFDHLRGGIKKELVSSTMSDLSSSEVESDLTESAMATPCDSSTNFPLDVEDNSRTITEVLPDNNRNSLVITDNELSSSSLAKRHSTSTCETISNERLLNSPSLNQDTQHTNTDKHDVDTTRNMQENKTNEDNHASSHNNKHLEESSPMKKKSGVSTPGSEKLGDFDVYNIESTLPQLDWTMLEQQLQRAAEEERQKEKSRRNDREEIRRKLAMGVDEDYYGGERAYKKPNLQTRLQGGMNLQICFMNDATSDQESINDENEQESSCRSPDNSPRAQTKQETEQIRKSPSSTSASSTSSASHQKSSSSPPPSKTEVEDEDFFSKQARLQDEARLALAQAPAMAHMQLEVEKQMKKKSPIAEIVGIPGFGAGRHRKLIRPVLSEMNLAQLQVVVNDLHTQIESQNEELVHLLVERDDLHMEQDSMLVDIEDLTRKQ